jgi:hypothetical protein
LCAVGFIAGRVFLLRWAMGEGKKIKQIKVNVSERMHADLALLAADDDRALSDMVAKVLKQYLYGRVTASEAKS